MRLFKKVFTSFTAVALTLLLSVTANAAITMPHVFPEDAANDYGEATALIIKLQDEGIDSATASKIATVDVDYAVETDYFQPQFIANSDGVWNQFPDEQRVDGVYTYDITGQFKAENTYNEIWIKTGYKNAGAASVESVVFKDADGNVVFQVGGEAATAEVKEETTTDDSTAAATSDTAETTATAETDTLPQTGTAPVALYVVGGLGLIMLGFAIKKNHMVEE